MPSNENDHHYEKSRPHTTSTTDENRLQQEEDTATAAAEEYLSDHSVAMRKAAQHLVDHSCCLMTDHDYGSASDDDVFTHQEPLHQLLSKLQTSQNPLPALQRQRQQHETAFWQRQRRDDDPIERIDSQQMHPTTFQNQFHKNNLPCVVTGLSATHFSELHDQWTKRRRTKHDTDKDKMMIHREWFLDKVGPDTMIPLQYSKNHTTITHNIGTQSVDAAGRAEECLTKSVSMKEWISILSTTTHQKEKDKEDTDKSMTHSLFYLKDWHLQQEWEQRHDQLPLLYTCPDIFEFDLLNSFLRQFFEKGDYRFCYWGPTGSSTALHADVLHSFSWSYNVCGSKRWTLYEPVQKQQQEDEESVDPFPEQGHHRRAVVSLIQRAGEAVFVPATWMHDVENLEETISINHNWITTANIDQTWTCLKLEMKAIQLELDGWEDKPTTETNESMLRGCTGLDVSAFLLMCMTRLLEILKTLLKRTRKENVQQEEKETQPNEDEWDASLIYHVVLQILEDRELQVRDRLEAVLQSPDLANSTMNCIHRLVRRENDVGNN